MVLCRVDGGKELPEAGETEHATRAARPDDLLRQALIMPLRGTLISLAVACSRVKIACLPAYCVATGFALPELSLF